MYIVIVEIWMDYWICIAWVKLSCAIALNCLTKMPSSSLQFDAIVWIALNCLVLNGILLWCTKLHCSSLLGSDLNFETNLSTIKCAINMSGVIVFTHFHPWRKWASKNIGRVSVCKWVTNNHFVFLNLYLTSHNSLKS